MHTRHPRTEIPLVNVNTPHMHGIQQGNNCNIMFNFKSLETPKRIQGYATNSYLIYMRTYSDNIHYSDVLIGRGAIEPVEAQFT